MNKGTETITDRESTLLNQYLQISMPEEFGQKGKRGPNAILWHTSVAAVMWVQILIVNLQDD